MTAFPYLSHTGFLGAAKASPDHPFAVAGVCWDGSVTNRPGARFGPRAIRTASHMLCDATHPYFDVSPTPFVGDAGDLALPNTGLEGMRAAMPGQVAPLIAAHQMVWLGGDHSITLPLLRAYRAHYGRPLAVVHFDAHCDTWTDHFGEPSGHGTWVYEAIQEGLVVPECMTQFGIRSAGDRAAREYVRDQGGLIFTARDLRGLASPAQLAPFVEQIRARWEAARPAAAVPELRHRRARPGLRARHRHARAGRAQHGAGVHAARGAQRPALRRHGLRGGRARPTTTRN